MLDKLVRVLIFCLALTSVSVSFVKPLYAHPGNTDSYGCHTCRTNCPSWGLSYGEYHCHTPKYDYPSIPDCPLFSYYNSLTGNCECYSGYITYGGKCISDSQYCRNILGFNSKYNVLTDKCECSYGYVLDSTGKCTYGDTVCRNKYGFHSRYDSLSKVCECGFGYVFNSAGTKCVSEDEACQEQYGYGAKATISGDKCECQYGYVFSGNECVLETSYEHFEDTGYGGLGSPPSNFNSTPSSEPKSIVGYKEMVTPQPAVAGESASSLGPAKTLTTPSTLSVEEKVFVYGTLSVVAVAFVWLISRVVKKRLRK